MDQRKYPRYHVEYVGSFSGERINSPGVIVDLSTAGGRARSATEFTKGEFLGVLIDIPRYEHPLHVPLAGVRWSHGQEFGMDFIQMEPDDQLRPRELVEHINSATALRNESP
ncbi:MAG TPA: PilZ domain-containing protein [Nitrospira sp.]|nr:PilZ domain-containing protein [Nitrospira sp.]